METTEIDKELIDSIIKVMLDASSDIYQTARSNQINLNGFDMTFPTMGAMEMSIGNNKIHQEGIDSSLQVREELRKAVVKLYEHSKSYNDTESS